MRTKIFYMALLMMLFCNNLNINAQDGGCDLCGPSTGTNKNMANGNYSATVGAGCETSGAFSFAVGYFAKTYSSNTIALGKYVKVKATNSVAIGSGSSSLESRMLVNNVPNSLMIGFNSCFPTLFVSNSTGFNMTGKVGIGNVTTPKSKLHVKSDINEDAGFILEPSNLSKTAFIQLHNDKNRISVRQDVGMSIMSQNGNIDFEANSVTMNARVAINTSPHFAEGYDYSLAVSGGILTTKVLVKEVSEWYDHVFDEDYNLMPLTGLEQYIGKNGHLPDMPSEGSVLSKGYDMVEMDGLLLKKIEELTLYTIELNNQIKRQQEIIEFLQSN